jgi:predicted  nucleic acid-binding Zn-ribbon protein
MTWIHEQNAANPKKTACGKEVLPFTQTTVKWTGELPTCPDCVKLLYKDIGA